MRKLLVFLLLLGAGLLLLYWLDRRASAPVEGLPVPEPAPLPEVGDEAQGVRFDGGPGQWARFDPVTKNPVLRLEAADARTLDGVDVLAGVIVELLDPAEKGVVQVRLRAERAYPRRVGTSQGMQPEWEARLELEGIQAEILSGFPLAPLSFQTAKAVIDLTDPALRTVRTDERFTASAPELALAGRGLLWHIDREELAIQHEGRVEVRRAGAASATLTAKGDGPLTVSRPEGPTGPVLLEAWEGATLEPGAQEPGRLEARHVTLRARKAEGGDEPFAIERLDAEGDVDWTSGDARFRGQRLGATFGPDGRVERARLEGDPRAELALLLSGGVLPDIGAAEPRVVVIEGQDALELVWKDGGYEMRAEAQPAAPGGPPPKRVPSIVAGDFRLESAASIDGWLSEDQRSARFRAGGGVVVTSGDATLEAAEFDVTLAPDASGETVLVGTASGSTRLAGNLPPDASRPDEAGRAFTLASPDGLKLERSARGWRVIESTRVEVSLADPDGFRARADRVSDFVVPQSGSGELAREGMRFRAQGAILVESEAGRLGGEELEVLAVEPVPHFVVRGTPESKAFITHEFGEASALEVELTGDTLHARGAVTGSAEIAAAGERGDARYTFAGDELVLDRSESAELLPGERVRTLRVLVTGNVQGSVSVGDETLVARCARLSAEYRARAVAATGDWQELGSLFIAEESVHADLVAKDGDLAVDCDRFEIERTASDVASGFRQLTASGDVRFEGRFGARERLDVGGDCEILVFDAERRGSLEPRPYGRVTLVGHDPQQNLPYRLTAERVDFAVSEQGSVRLVALEPELRMLGLRTRAEHFTADDQTGVVLSGAVRVAGTTSAHVPFTLDAGEVVLVGRRASDESLAAEDQLDSLSARGGVDFRLADGLRARGDVLTVRRSTGLLRLEGMPASFELGTTRLEAEWVEFDPVLQVLVSTGRGRMIAPQESTTGAAVGESWTLDFLSASTLLELDSVVLVIQEPLFRTAGYTSALRASWAIFWLNREAFQDAGKRDELLEGLRGALASLKTLPKGATMAQVLALFREAELAGLLREVYFEGPVEVLMSGELLARADAIYLDASSQHGWLARATVHLGRQFLGQRQEKLIIKADWLRLSSDGSLRADRATVTACNFDEPHVSVVTGDLRIDPVDSPGEGHYQLRLEDNRVELYDKLRVPLPTIDFATDEEFKPLLPTLSLANSARFGTLLGFAFTRPADNVGELFDKIARPDEAEKKPTLPGSVQRSDVDAHYKVDGSYLGSRGGLIDLGLEIEAKDSYWFDLYLGVAIDSGDDKGFVRVDEDDRDSLRRWLRSQAYFDRGKNAWSFSYSDQSDAGVQSEFYEGQFLRYERAENYVQWRRSSDENFAQASVKVRLDEFRTDVEELPSVSGYRGRSPLLNLGRLTLLHTGDVRAEYLRRRAGEEPHSPFEQPPTFGVAPGFGSPDGLGDREVARVDTTQTLELPVPLGAGWKLTPFVSARATAWTEGIEEEDSPARLLAEGGLRVGATYWKRTRRGRLHVLAPFIEYRTELEREDDDGSPVIFDSNDSLLSGDFLRLGSRARFGATRGEDAMLDVDLVGTHASGRSDGAPDGWLPIEVFARLLLEPFGHEFEVFHDGRYDLENSRTEYSLVSFGTHFGEQWGVQFSHQRGLDGDGEPFFEAASVSGLYRWTEKWEFEARESFSLLEDQELDTKFVLRRYGHDLVFEIETGVREGEGSSFGLSLKPRFGYHPPRVGYVPW